MSENTRKIPWRDIEIQITLPEATDYRNAASEIDLDCVDYPGVGTVTVYVGPDAKCYWWYEGNQRAVVHAPVSDPDKLMRDACNKLYDRRLTYLEKIRLDREEMEAHARRVAQTEQDRMDLFENFGRVQA